VLQRCCSGVAVVDSRGTTNGTFGVIDHLYDMWCYGGVTLMLQWCCHGVTMMLPWWCLWSAVILGGWT
jgi:hypothetical protein